MNRKSTPETAIPSISLAELIAQAGGTPEGRACECIVVDGDTPLQPVPFLGRLDAFIIGVCTQGRSTFSLNLREYRVSRDMLFIFGPQSVLEARSNKRFQAHILILSPEFLRRLTIDTKRILQLFLKLSDHPCIELRPEESRLLGDYIRLIGAERQEPEQQFTQDIVGELIAASIYKVSNILHRYLAEHPEAEARMPNRTETHFRQFMELLSIHYKQERSVNFYARRLCISPKYLTTLIKRISGKPVSDWIDRFVVIEAQSLLKYTNMSIQEIADHLNFPNQSFFGSYFKRQTGLSPSQYKAQGK